MIIDLKQSSAFEEVFASDNSRAPPESEKQIFRRYLTDRPWLGRQDAVRQQLASTGRLIGVTHDALTPVGILLDGLRHQQPMSVIRLGDGESNLLTWPYHQQTLILNAVCVREIIRIQEIKIPLDIQEIELMRELLFKSICAADVIGLIGLQRFPKINQMGENDAIFEPTPDEFYAIAQADWRGGCGYVRMVEFACADLPKVNSSALFCSAHLYIAIGRSLKRLSAAAKRTIFVAYGNGKADAIMRRLSASNIQYIDLAHVLNGHHEVTIGVFACLSAFANSIGDIEPGTLVLISAGPWAELFCDIVKSKGGVGVDFGSGLDFFSGANVRPVHTHFDAALIEG